MRAALHKLRHELEFDKPEVLNKYLGCLHEFKKSNGISQVCFDMVDYCRTACEEFAQEAGRKLKYVASPYLADPKDKA